MDLKMAKIWDIIKGIFFPTKKEDVEPVFSSDMTIEGAEPEKEEEPPVVVEKEKLIWISKIKVEKRIPESELPAYLKKGYKRGRKKAKKPTK